MWETGLLILVLLFGSSPALSAPGSFASTLDCLSCHDEKQYRQDFENSVHGANGCPSCHDFTTTVLGEHVSGGDAAAQVDCLPCHKQEAQTYSRSVHRLNGLGCTECHLKIHRLSAWRNVKQTAVETCLFCHSQDDYRKSVHGRAVAGGNEDAAACHDCHLLHDVQSTSSFTSSQMQAFKVEACISCHADQARMARNQVFPNAVDSYIESYHGKSYRLGSSQQTAGCADCHTAHRVLPRSDPNSSLHGDNLVATCAQCHLAATPLFTQFYAHGDYRDRQHYPLLFWTFMGMTGLLVAVFVIFWVHSILWMFRGFVDNRQKLAAQARGEVRLIPSAHKQYRRFPRRYIFFHLIVISSFLGLSLTGLPLKFSDQPWATAMMSFYGGVEYAGLLHRACAVLTFYYFVAALLMSFDFLFFNKNAPGGWLARLFGPDSLMPNLKDLRDLRGMFKWFLFRGPKPNFERWTYWEKFDFLAVFWGMFAIGGSGLMLWFPEFFGSFLPGWVFNLATIIHSDEALLATGFIFTVHFFNTHGRPEKFPMDFVIFNGQISKQEFIEERGAQWQRYEDTGMLEQVEVEKNSSVLYDFLLKGFGFLALFTGMGLAFLMFIAFVWA